MINNINFMGKGAGYFSPFAAVGKTAKESVARAEKEAVQKASDHFRHDTPIEKIGEKIGDVDKSTYFPFGAPTEKISPQVGKNLDIVVPDYLP